MEPAAPPFAARWAHVPGLRARLWAQGAAARLPLLALSLSSHFALRGGLSLTALLAHAAVIGLLQAAVGAAAALVIVPAGARTLRLLRWLHDNPTLNRLLSGQPAEQLGPLVAVLDGMQARLPAARAALLSVPGVERLCVTTPDGVTLDGFIAGRVPGGGGPQRLDSARRPVILYLCGNGECFEFAGSALLQSWYVQRGCAVAAINYRGVGRSGGVMSRRDGAVIDAASALAYLTAGCGFSPSQVVLLGHSIGGAFGAEAARALPGVLLVYDRSFSRLSDVALYHVAAPAVEGPLAATSAGTAVRALVRSAIRHAACWELDAAAHWLHVAARVLVYSPHDAVIPLRAQMAAARGLHRDPPREAPATGGSAWGGERKAGSGGGDAGDVEQQEEEGTCVLRLAPSSSRRSVDEHNRALADDEERRLFAAIADHVAGRRLKRSA